MDFVNEIIGLLIVLFVLFFPLLRRLLVDKPKKKQRQESSVDAPSKKLPQPPKSSEKKAKNYFVFNDLKIQKPKSRRPTIAQRNKSPLSRIEKFPLKKKWVVYHEILKFPEGGLEHEHLSTHLHPFE